MNIVFFGTGSFGIPSLAALKNSSHIILKTVVSPDKPQGRNLKLKFSPVKEWALANQVPIFQPDNVNSEASIRELEKLKADLFVVVSFGALFSKKIIEMPRFLTLNVHSSLLPRYRGAAPIHRAMLDRNAETGVSVMRMVEKLDAGDVILQKKTAIRAEDDIVSLEERLNGLGAQALLEAISQIENGTAVFTPQDEHLSSYAKKIKKEEGHIDWTRSASEINARVRAFKVWPGAFSFYKEKRVLILETTPTVTGRGESLNPGGIVLSPDKRNIFVAAGDFLVEVKTLQLEGRRALSAPEFLKGFPLEAGQIFA